MIITSFWRIYRANLFEMIEFHHQGDVQQIIESDMVEQVKQLDELKRWDAQSQKLLTIGDMEKRIQEAEKMMIMIGQIPLDVRYKHRVYNNVKKLFDGMMK